MSTRVPWVGTWQVKLQVPHPGLLTQRDRVRLNMAMSMFLLGGELPVTSLCCRSEAMPLSFTLNCFRPGGKEP